jgi:hypothetical protein
MGLNPLFRPFIEQTPVAVLGCAVLERLLDPQPLDALFANTARRQYTRTLLFAAAVDLMAQVVLGRKPSVHAAYKSLVDPPLVSDQAVYDKLQRMELAVSAALVEHSARRAANVIRSLQASHPSWLQGYHVNIIDGNHLEATAHRLEELRHTWAAPLPGKGLVVLDQPTMTARHILLTENGQAQERSLLPDVLPLVQRRDLWLADRNFCTLDFLFGLDARQAGFVIRRHGTLKGEPVGPVRTKGRCATGFVSERRLRLTHQDGRTLVVRRVTVHLDEATEDGDTAIHLLTNLPVKVAPAWRVAELYRRRWTVEGLFLEVATTLACAVKTLAYPKAALFAFCVGLWAANAVAVLKAALRATHGEEAAASLSAYYLTSEIRETYRGLRVALGTEAWEELRRLDDEEFAGTMREIAGHMVLRRYTKNPRGPKKKPPQRRRYRNGEHIATSKVLEGRKSGK